MTISPPPKPKRRHWRIIALLFVGMALTIWWSERSATERRDQWVAQAKGYGLSVAVKPVVRDGWQGRLLTLLGVVRPDVFIRNAGDVDTIISIGDGCPPDVGFTVIAFFEESQIQKLQSEFPLHRITMQPLTVTN